ncbi:MAG: DNA polymerase III subunit beta [Melioribacter sp.]|nr:DNA polymerase III subunit beta [Melioribacter sp.]
MEFRVNSKELEKHLSKIIPAVPTRTPMKILENFLFDINDGLLTIYATDLDLSLKSFMNVVSDANLKLVLPAKLLYDVVRSLKETTITFQVQQQNKKINLLTDTGKYVISYLEPEEFPEIPTVNEENKQEVNIVEINGDELKEAIDKTAFAMSKEEVRPALQGTLFEFTEEGLRFVTTDGHRLVNLLKRNINAPIKKQYIVPERAINILSRILDEKIVKVYFTNTYASFKLNDIELISRLISQKYPDYASVIPLENEYLLKVKTQELNDTIKRMMLFSTSNTRKVKFSLSKENIEVKAEDIDTGASGEEKLKCEYQGEPMDIGFNSQYMNEILSHLSDSEEVLFKLHSPTKAVIIEPVEKKEELDLMMLLMPVRINA